MSTYKEGWIKHETENFFVLENGAKGYEVYRKGICAAQKIASIGHGAGPNLGIERAISECNRRQELSNAASRHN